MTKAVIIFSGGLDSVCSAAFLKQKYDLFAISFSYGQRATNEIKSAKILSKILKFNQVKILDISFMKNLYGKSNVLTDSHKKMPNQFNYSIVAPIRNAIFLSIAAGWAFTLKASLVAYGAHKDDKNYPDCRPGFSKKLETALNLGEIDGINVGLRKKIEIWSPYKAGLNKTELLEKGYEILGDEIFRTWSCYENKKFHCGLCESCINRKKAFSKSGIEDKTKYLKLNIH